MKIDFRQQYEDPQEALRSAMDGRQADLWTALPGIIQSYNSTELTVEVQPAIQALYTGADLSQKFVNLPTLVDVPVVFPRGGSYTLTFPIQPGDECLVVFASRCIDNWWSQGGVQTQYELRMHDLSDGFAFVGPFSQITAPSLTGVSTTTTQLRSNDGNLFVEIDESSNTINVKAPIVNINASQQINLNSPLVKASGAIQAAANITAGAGGAGSVTLLGHVHGRGTVAAGTISPTPGS